MLLARNILDLGLRVSLRRMCISFSVIRGHTPILIGKDREWIPLMLSFMLFLKRIRLFSVCCCFVCQGVRVHHLFLLPTEVRKWHWIFWNYSNRWLWAKCSCWELNLVSSGRIVSVLNHKVLSPALTLPLKAFYCNVKRLSKGMALICDQDS